MLYWRIYASLGLTELKARTEECILQTFPLAQSYCIKLCNPQYPCFAKYFKYTCFKYLKYCWTISDAVRSLRSGSTLAQVIACCLIAHGHYLDHRWLLIKDVLWHSPDSNFTRSAHELKSIKCVRRLHFQIAATSPRGQRVNSLSLSDAYIHW